MKLLLITADPATLGWKSLPKKKAFFERLFPGEVDIIYMEAEPEVVDGKITHEWLRNFAKPVSPAYTFVGFHGSEKQKKKWKIKNSLNGADPNGRSLFYFFADEHSRRKGLNKFEQSGGHELSHEYYDRTGEIDLTHAWHDIIPDITGLFRSFKWNKILQAEKSFLLRLIDSLKPAPKSDDLLPLIKRKLDLVMRDMASLGLPMRVVEGYRSAARQDQLYAQGRNGDTRPIVTNAKGGESLHQYGVAADLIFTKTGYDAPQTHWLTYGEIAKKHGFEWGGDWKNFPDRPHIQLLLGYTLKDFKTNKVNYTKYV